MFSFLKPDSLLSSKYIDHHDCFDVFSQIGFAAAYDAATLSVGAGTCVINTDPSYNTLTTGNVLNNTEGIRTNMAIFNRDRAPIAQIAVQFSALADRRFRFGFINVGGTAEEAYWEYDINNSPNWHVVHIDGAAVRTEIDTGIPATVPAQNLQISIDEDGNIHAWFKANGENWQEIDVTALPVLVDENYFLQYCVETLDAVAVDALVDYILWRRLKDN